MLGFSIDVSALRASQTALDVIAQNLANANTPGYHRQVTRFADRTPIELRGHLMGTGVDVAEIRRRFDLVTEDALTTNIAEKSDVAHQLRVLRQVESLLTPGTGSLHERLQGFFNELQELAVRPEDSTLRRIALERASSLAGEFNRLADGLAELRNQLDADIETTVDEVNNLLRDLADVNEQIRIAEGRGLKPNDLRDRRNQLVNELAQLVDPQVVEQGKHQTALLLGQGAVLVGAEPVELQYEVDAAGNPSVTLPGLDLELSFAGGRLAGLLTARNELLAGHAAKLDALASKLIETVDAVHATGLGLDGSFSVLTGRRGVADITAPLESAGTPFPVNAGDLYLSVTEQATGNRRLHRVAIDPATQSLQDVAAAISGVSGVQGLVDSQTGRLTITASPGFVFDFAGRLETDPDLTGFTGTAVPELQGTYTGAANDQFTVQVTGSGTVGVTDGLSLEVRNQAGQLLATLDVGADYEPGSALNVADGVTVSLSSGTVNAGDTFSTPMVAQPDTAGMLPALGLNSFFSGSSAGDIRVNPALTENPRRLAASRSGQPGDNENLRDLIALRDAPLLASGTLTFEEALAELTTDAGNQVRSLNQVEGHLDLLGQRLETERESFSGVDPNEELVRMLQFQRSFQASARHLATLNETLDELFTILG